MPVGLYSAVVDSLIAVIVDNILYCFVHSTPFTCVPFTQRASHTKEYILQTVRHLQGVSFARKYEIRSGEIKATQDVYRCSLFATMDSKRRRDE